MKYKYSYDLLQGLDGSIQVKHLEEGIVHRGNYNYYHMYLILFVQGTAEISCIQTDYCLSSHFIITNIIILPMSYLSIRNVK